MKTRITAPVYWIALSLIAAGQLAVAADGKPPAAPARATPGVQKVQIAGAAQPAAQVQNVKADQFEKLRKDKSNVVLDVRTPAEYANGHMPGAVNIDFNAPDFEKKVKELDKEKTYLVHCAGGVRSAKAAAKMLKLDFTKLYNLEEGMKGWEKAGNVPQK